MNTLNFNFTCLDGEYHLVANYAEELTYTIESTIVVLPNKSGSLNKEQTLIFKELLKQAKIENWDQSYLGDGIEDACKWETILIKDNKKYVSSGVESYEPYFYEYFIKALMMIDEKADYFLVNC